MRPLRVVGRLLLCLPLPVRWVPAAGWIALIWELSSRSIAAPAGSGFGFGVFWNLAHPFEFGVLAVLLALLLPRTDGWPRLDAPARIGLAALIVCLAAADELHQSTIPERNASLLDVVSDTVGAWCALSAARRVAEHDALALKRSVIRGLCACLAAALAATLGTILFPELDWL